MENGSFSKEILVAASQNTRERDYWLSQFSGDWVKSDFQRFPGKSIKNERLIHTITFKFPGALFSQLMKLSGYSDYRLHITLVAGLTLLIYKYTANKDVLMGTSIYKQDIEGEFVNTILPLRNEVVVDLDFKEFLLKVAQQVFDANEKQNYPMETLLYKLNKIFSPDDFPLFDIAVLLENIHNKNYLQHINLNILFLFIRNHDSLEGIVEYNASHYKKDFIERLVIHFINLLEQCVSDMKRQLSHIDILSPEEKKQILIEFNHNKREIPGNKTIVHLIEEQADIIPDRIAVVCEDHEATYKKLSEESNRIANYLALEQHINADESVGILMERSINFITAILGVWKARAAYIPISPGLPQDRMKTIINESGIRIILSQKKYIRTLNHLQWECQSLHTFMCTDSTDIYSEEEVEKSILMDEGYRDFLTRTGENEVDKGGWISSYTGKPLPLEVLDEFGDNYLIKLTPLLHEKLRVLDIGCGTGFTMYRVAPRVEYYLATDISKECIERNKKRIKEKGCQNIDLLCIPAHQIDSIDEKNFDLVIMTAVVQSFHGHNYLRQVIGKIIGIMGERGHILIGDIPELETKDEVIRDLLRFKYENIGKNYDTITNRVDLFLSRRFFEDLAVEFPEISKIEFSGKISKQENELSKNRLDVMIQVDKKKKNPGKTGTKHKYQHDRRTLERYGSAKVRPGVMVKPHDLAYVIYTSGSTGKPKGVMVEHRGMLNHIRAKANDLEMTAQSIVAQNASQTFDISVWQLLTALTLGGKTVIYPDEVFLEPGHFIRQLIDEGVTILEVVPSYLSIMFDILLGESGPLQLPLQYLLVTGEEVKPHQVNRWFELYPCIKMVNAYGPTEASDDITHCIMDRPPDKERVPLGRSLQNLNVYIVDEHINLCPVGVPGEICVSGIGVGRGYLNDARKTMQAFLPDPFVARKRLRFYKTGDLGYWLPDGTIEFLGRKDYQVKIRGYRIELGEIECKLLEHPAVKETVVIDREDSEGKYLCAYGVPAAAGKFNILDLREYLKNKLPAYMVPAYFVDLEQIPLTPNGKIDRNALPDPVKVKPPAFMPYMTEEILKQRILESRKISPMKNRIESEMEKEKEPVHRLSGKERHQLLYAFNATAADMELPGDKTLVDLLETQALKTPDRRGVVYKDEMVTYRELNRRIIGLARLLGLKGVKANHVVGLMLENSIEMIVGIYAIMKAGGAFFPIDIEYPEDRKRFMLKETNAKQLLTLGEYDYLFDNQCEIINIKDGDPLMDKPTEPGVIKPGAGVNLAYIVFTSGSTGKPKGSAVSLKGLLSFIHWFAKKFGFNAEDKVLLTTSISFDLTYRKIFTPLITGGTLCITGLNYYDPGVVLREIWQHRVSWINVTPSMIYQLMKVEEAIKKLASLSYVFFSGETLYVKPLMEWIKSGYFHAEMVNTYGVTERTCITTFYTIKQPEKYNETTVPIGKPIDNCRVYILGKDLNPVPVGVMGELFIGGEGLARGYINDIQLTSRKFITIPTIGLMNRLYRTGDFGRWQPDGNIEFLGRMDHQVKIRGFRIELGEIENVLLKTKNIKEAAVVLREKHDAEKYLCAFMVSEHPLPEFEVRETLLRQLPIYMIPSRYVQLEKMPLNPNGKVDRMRLEVIDIDINTMEAFQVPRNETEEKLAGVWSEVLEIEKNNISIDDNFFELGGHSLKAIILITRIHKTLNVKIPLAEIFKGSTIRKMAEYIGAKTAANPFQSISPTEKKEYYPLSSGEKRLYIIHQMNEGSIVHNMSKVLQLEGNLDVGHLEKTFLALIKRHEVFRTSFFVTAVEPVQKVHENVDFKIQYHSISPHSPHSIEEIIRDFIKPFNLSRAPLIKIGLIKVEEGYPLGQPIKARHILLVDIHHIISDGTSHTVLEQDFIKLYRGEELPPLRLQYKDFSEWQNKFHQTSESKKQEKYWLERFKDHLPVLNMSMLADYPRPTARNPEGDTLSFEIGEELTSMIKKLAEETGTTIFIVLMTAYYVLLSKYTGQDNIIVGTGIAGREHADLEKIIGLFVNMLAIRNHPSGDKTFRDFLKEVKKNALEAYENQSFPFDELVKLLGIERSLNRHPVFDIQFTFQNDMFETGNKAELIISNLEIKPYQFAHVGWQSEFDLSLSGFQTKDKILMAVYYMTSLFKRSTIQGMVSNYIEILEEVLKNGNVKIKEIILSHELLSGKSEYCQYEYMEFTF